MKNKTKKCAHCDSEFQPFKSTDKACSPDCAKALQKVKKIKPKKKKKPKALSIGKLTDKAATLLQRLVRLKASDDNGYCSCVTCGVTRRFDDRMQGGHFIERGVKKTKLMEENIHPQCAYCNKWGMQKTSIVLGYRKYMVSMYGEEFVEELECAKNDKTFKLYRPELEEMIIELSERVREQEKRIGV